MRELWHFIRHFAHLLHFIRGVVVAIFAIIILSAIVLMLVEGLSVGESLYFTAVTALTVGYGDITPKTAAGQVVSIVIGFLGVLFNGIVVAVAVRALADAVEEDRKTQGKQ